MHISEITSLWLLAGVVAALVMVAAVCATKDRNATQQLDKERDSLAHDRADFENRARPPRD